MLILFLVPCGVNASTCPVEFSQSSNQLDSLGHSEVLFLRSEINHASQSIYSYGKVEHPSLVSTYRAILYKTNLDLFGQWVKIYDFDPVDKAMHLKQDGSSIFVIEQTPGLKFHEIDTSDGSVKGYLHTNKLAYSSRSKIYSNSDGASMYFTVLESNEARI